MRDQTDDLKMERAAWETDTYNPNEEEKKNNFYSPILPIGIERRLTDASSHNDNYDAYRFE